jgi:hypothetical protein
MVAAWLASKSPKAGRVSPAEKHTIYIIQQRAQGREGKHIMCRFNGLSWRGEPSLMEGNMNHAWKEGVAHSFANSVVVPVNTCSQRAAPNNDAAQSQGQVYMIQVLTSITSSQANCISTREDKRSGQSCWLASSRNLRIIVSDQKKTQ